MSPQKRKVMLRKIDSKRKMEDFQRNKDRRERGEAMGWRPVELSLSKKGS